MKTNHANHDQLLMAKGFKEVNEEARRRRKFLEIGDIENPRSQIFHLKNIYWGSKENV